MEEDLSDLRHVRRELFDQLHRGYPGGCGSRMVHVLRDAAEPLLLVFRRHIGRNIRFLPAVQHGGAGLRHDGDVRRHLPGAVAQGERSRQLALRPCRIFALSDPVWGGSVHGSGDAGHSRRADAAEKTVGEGRG